MRKSLSMHVINEIQQNSTYPDAGYPDLFGPASKGFLIVILQHLFISQIFPPFVK